MKARALSSCPLACGAALPHEHDVGDAVPCDGPRVGDPGVRDPAYPCDAYDPGTPAGSCESDGHYLCYQEPGCRGFSWDSEIGRMVRP